MTKTNYLSFSTTSLEENILTSLDNSALSEERLNECIAIFSKHVRPNVKYIHVAVMTNRNDSWWRKLTVHPMVNWLSKLKSEDIIESFSYELTGKKYVPVKYDTMKYVKYLLSGKNTFTSYGDFKVKVHCQPQKFRAEEFVSMMIIHKNTCVFLAPE